MQNEFSDLVLQMRIKNYYSARSFWEKFKDDLQISYEHYKRIEKGGVPSLKNALSVIAVLDMDEEFALNAWIRSQLTEPRHKAFFQKPRSVEEERYRENKRTITPNDAEALELNPVLYKIIIYLSLFSGRRIITAKELANDFNFTLREAKVYINKLRAMRIIDLRDERLVFLGWISIPDEAKYRSIRRRNFKSFVLEHLQQDYSEEWSHERIVVRRIKKKNLDELKERLCNLYRWYLNNDLEEIDEDGIPYAFFSGGAPIQSFKKSQYFYDLLDIEDDPINEGVKA